MDKGELRAGLYNLHKVYKPGVGYVTPCPVCGRPVNYHKAEVHEWLVKRNAVPVEMQDLIFVPENCVLIHCECHDNSREVTAACKEFVTRRVSPYKIRLWYKNLIYGHGLSLPRGISTDDPSEWLDSIIHTGG